MDLVYSTLRTASAFLLTYVSLKAGKSPHLKNEDDQPTDDRLFSMIKVFIQNNALLYILHAAQLVYYLYWAVYTKVEPLSLFEVGIYSIGLGALSFRLWAMKTLGDFFTFEVVIRKKHQLITTGPYKYLMHPSYTGIIIGNPFTLYFFLRSWMIAAAIFVLYSIIILFIRIPDEERVLSLNFKSTFPEYKKARWRIIPFIY